MKCIGKICSYLLFLSLPFCCIFARPVNIHEAEKAVQGWLKQSPQPFGVSPGNQVQKVEAFASKSGTIDYYIVYLKPSGFVIVSSDDLIEPIIGFADDGKFQEFRIAFIYRQYLNLPNYRKTMPKTSGKNI